MANLAAEKRKVFLVIPWALSHQGGVTKVVQQIGLFWGKDDFFQPVLAVDDWNHPVEHWSNGDLYFRFRALVIKGFLSSVFSVLRLPFALYKINRLLRVHSVAAVNFHYTDYSPLGIAILKRLKFYRGRLVISFHGTDVRHAPNALERMLHLFCLRSADALVACSSSLADRAAATFGLDRRRFDVVLNGVDVSIFRPGAPPTDALMGRLPEDFVVNIGSFIPRKAQLGLIDAFAMVAARFPQLHLCIAGPEGPLLPELREKVAGLGLGQRIHFFVGISAPDVAHLLTKARLCVQPALAESMPLSMLEAGACGVPVVASNIPGHDELIVDGETGRLFEVGNAPDCARVISEALLDAAAGRASAHRFRGFIHAHLTWPSCVGHYRRIYGIGAR